MSDGGVESTEEQTGSTGMVFAVYILYLVGIVVWLTDFIAVVLAYVGRGAAQDWLKSHYAFQIRTFWIGLLVVVICLLLTYLDVVAHHLYFAFSGSIPLEIVYSDSTIYFLYSAVSGFLSAMASSELVFLITSLVVYVSFIIWLIVRCARGMMYLSKGKEHPNPKSWLFG